MNNYFLKLSGELGGAIKHLQKLKCNIVRTEGTS